MGFEQYVSTETVRKLRAFSTMARTAQGPHPEDWKRWHVFVMAAQAENHDIPYFHAKDWLIENSWSEERASEFAIRFDAGLQLLHHTR